MEGCGPDGGRLDCLSTGDPCDAGHA
jgi:hypothetical protein